jgi:hypothetical protein
MDVLRKEERQTINRARVAFCEISREEDCSTTDKAQESEENL